MTGIRSPAGFFLHTDLTGQKLQAAFVLSVMAKCTTRAKRLTDWILIFAALLLPISAMAQDEAITVPDEVKRFVEAKRISIALESGDLNADGRKDLVLVVSDVVGESDPYEEGAGSRSVLILIRQSDGSLSLAARNDLVAMCRNCGGVFGDPFEGVTIRGTRFTVSNYGGSNERWSYNYMFAYSRRDQNWQLVRAEESHFHTLDPDRTMRTRVYTPPKHFGLINFADFDPDNFRGKGKK